MPDIRAFRSLFSITVLFVVTGCGGPTAPSKSAKPLDFEAESHRTEQKRDAARFAGSATSVANIDVESYRLKGHFDWFRLKLLATVQIQLRATADLQVVELDSKVDVRAVREGARPVAFANEKGVLKIQRPLQSGARVTLSVEYEASANQLPDGDTSALVAVTPRGGDPVRARTVSTFSEPLSAAEWMPVHNRPFDRALFSAEMDMEPGERMISNGDLALDQVVANKRTMRYQTRYTLPVYLMAFSIGDFAITTRYHGSLPVSVWARRGLPVDVDGVLDALVGQIKKFEKLMVPYPFEKYSLVLLPEFTGGIEHAGITFQGETSSSQGKLSRDFGLTAHELGHQWFGDLVTIETWDDLWIKEGMATLLAEEASRDFEDRNGSGRLFATEFNVHDGDAVHDPNLAPENKYTSGPYGRAAWVYTQLRSVLGEAKFWGVLRQLLNEKRFSSVGTEEMITRFSAALGPELTTVLRSALSSKEIPHLVAKTDGAGTKLMVSDTTRTLLAPIEVRRYSPFSKSVPTKTSLLGGDELLLTSLASDDSLLVIDPQERHPLMELVEEASFAKLIAPRLAPRTELAEDLLLSLGGNVQSMALHEPSVWKMTPARFPTIYKKLSSEHARYLAIESACDLAADTTWKTPITDALLAPPYLGMPDHSGGKELSGCRKTVGDDLLLSRFRQIAKDPSNQSWSEAELYSLSLISSDASTAFEFASALASDGASNRSRQIGLQLMRTHLSNTDGFAAPSSFEKPRWIAVLRKAVATYDSMETLPIAMDALKVTMDKEAGPAYASVVMRSTKVSRQREAICDAHHVLKGDTAAWQAFVRDLGNLKALPASLQQLVQAPEKCET